jgi:hypothetical protein
VDILVPVVTLAMLAAAVLAIAATVPAADDGLIPLPRNEIAHLLAALILRPAHDPARLLHWSCWRRRHQYRARACHYEQQATQDQGT